MGCVLGWERRKTNPRTTGHVVEPSAQPVEGPSSWAGVELSKSSSTRAIVQCGLAHLHVCLSRTPRSFVTFTSSLCDRGPWLNQNLPGLDGLARQCTPRTHLPPAPSGEVTGAQILAQLPTWVLSIQIPVSGGTITH